MKDEITILSSKVDQSFAEQQRRKEAAELATALTTADKSYDDLVRDGAAMERLVKNPDFKVYRRILGEALAQLVLRMRYMAKEDLPAMQGALLHHDVICKLPEKVVDVAARLVAARRSGGEHDGYPA